MGYRKLVPILCLGSKLMSSIWSRPRERRAGRGEASTSQRTIAPRQNRSGVGKESSLSREGTRRALQTRRLSIFYGNELVLKRAARERSLKSNLRLFPQQRSSREDGGNPFSQSVAPSDLLLPVCPCRLICWQAHRQASMRSRANTYNQAHTALACSCHSWKIKLFCRCRDHG